jgi:type IV secretory pathway VirB4 component
MSSQPKYFHQINNERDVAPFLPYSSHVSPNTIVTKDGDYMRIWKLAGISFETADADEILLRKEQLNTLYRSIGSSNVALWSHCVHRQTSDRLKSSFDNEFCRNFDTKYYDSFVGYRMMANELYLTVVYRPNPSRIDKAFVKAGRRSHAQIMEDQRAAIRKLDDIAYQVESSLRRYGLDEKQGGGPEELSTYEENGVLFSHALSFLNFLVSG